MELDLERITHPLRLAKGSHQPGSGRGCSMNLVSYVTGEVEISDYPACASASIAMLVQWVNDALAGYDAPDGTLLSPADSIIALELGWLTIGTSGHEDVEPEWIQWMLSEVRAYQCDLLGHFARALGHYQFDRFSRALTSIYLGVVGVHGNRYGADHEVAEFFKRALLKYRELAGLDDVPPPSTDDINSALDRIHAKV